MSQSKCFISGIGIVCNEALSISQFQSKLIHSTRSISTVQQDDCDWIEFSTPLHSFEFVEEESKPGQFYSLEKLQRLQRKYGDSVKFLALAVDDAFQDRYLRGYSKIDLKDTIILLAGSNYNKRFDYLVAKEYFTEQRLPKPSYIEQMLDSYLLSAISEIFDLKIPAFSIGATSASSLICLDTAAKFIKGKVFKTAIILSPAVQISPLEVLSLKRTGVLAQEDHFIPLDRKSTGFIPGKSYNCIILDAEARGSDITILGTSQVLSGTATTSPCADSEVRVMNEVLSQAGIRAKDVNYICAHGTGTPQGDAIELEAISEVFGNHAPMINSNKSLVGHCLTSSGSLSVIASILQMRGSFVHGNPGYEDSHIHSLNIEKYTRTGCNIDISLVNSYGFNGINCSALLGSV